MPFKYNAAQANTVYGGNVPHGLQQGPIQEGNADWGSSDDGIDKAVNDWAQRGQRVPARVMPDGGIEFNPRQDFSNHADFHSPVRHWAENWLPRAQATYTPEGGFDFGHKPGPRVVSRQEAAICEGARTAITGAIGVGAARYGGPMGGVVAGAVGRALTNGMCDVGGHEACCPGHHQ